MLRTSEIPLQYNLFSGELVDNRTTEQKRRDHQLQIPTQLLMFSQRDIAQIGVSANPRMDLSPGKLKLIAEDPRTEEEIERDRLREAERLTMALFAEPAAVTDPSTLPDKSLPTEHPPYSPKSGAETVELEDEDEEDPEPLPPLEPPLSKFAAYRQLVAAAQEQTATVSASPPVQIAQRISLSVAQFEAKRAGLNETEIATALTIGEFCGRSAQNPLLPAQAVKVNDPEPVKVGEGESETAGTKADESEIPILWLYRSDLIKRRSDLAEKIQSLSEYEIEALAALVGEALEEFYWIQLNVVLSLYLDHELRLSLRVPTDKQPTP